MRSGAPGDRHEEAGELDEESIDESGKSCPGRSPPPGGPPLRHAGEPRGEAARRSVGGRVSGPGDSAPKHPDFGGSQRTQTMRMATAEVRKRGPGSRSAPPGSQSSASSHMPHAREPGGLGGGPPPMVGGEQPREGKKPHAAGAPKAQPSGESDAGVVPKKSTKTRVTPVEPMEGRPKAKGNPLNVNARRTLGRGSASLRGAGRTAKGGGRRNDHRPADHRRSSLISRLRRPEVGARCGKSARRVLSGGRPEPTDEGQRRAVPTGTGKAARVSSVRAFTHRVRASSTRT